MTDVPTGLAPGVPDPGAAEPARMSPLSRYVNVFFSPGAVFDDIRRDPRGWWVPIIIGTLVASLFAGIYFQRFSSLQGEIEANQIRNNDAMKSFMAPEMIDKQVQQTIKLADATPTWQRQARRIALLPAFSFFFVWLLTAFFTVVSLAMGWIKDLRGWRFLALIALSIPAFFLSFCSEAVPRAVAGFAAAKGVYTPVSTGVVALGAGLSLAGAALLAWILFRTSRDPMLGRIVGAVSYAGAPLAVSALVGAIIALIKAPDATALEEFVPSSLGAIMGLKDGAIASLTKSLDIFILWFMVLLTIGLARALGRRPGAVAWAVFVPWGVWVVGKAALAAVFSMGS